MKSMNWNTGVCVVLLAIMAIVVMAISVSADPAAPTALNAVQTSTRNLSTLPAQTMGAQGGNVTEMNIQALTITQSWQGYYGNISGVITLQDSTNSTFYNWSLTSFQGRVYATRANSITWSQVNCTNSTNRTSEETFLGQTASDGDSVTNTFNTTTHPGFTVAGTAVIAPNSCFSTNGYVNNNTQANSYDMLLLSPTNGQIIYATIANSSTVGFDGRQHDFQLLVGENEKVGNIGATTYYFWTEFS
jgi:hypothetical protein